MEALIVQSTGASTATAGGLSVAIGRPRRLLGSPPSSQEIVMTWTPSILRIDRRGMASVVAAAIVVVVACTTGTALDKDDGGTPRPIASVDVTPSLTTLTQVGATVQLNATVKDDLGAVV